MMGDELKMGCGNKKIGILTFWGVPNYGAFAQAYALNKKIRELFPGYNVEHIGYLNDEHKKLYYDKNIPMLKIQGNPSQLLFYKSIYWYLLGVYQYYTEPRRTYSIFNEAWNIIPNIKISTIEELEGQKWDIVVTGSDCIWQFSTDAFGCDAHLVGKDLKYNKLIAYASSFGNQITDKIPNFVAEQLLKYDYVSIRDTFSKNLVHSITEGKCKTNLVLDPTLIYDFTADDNIDYYDNEGRKYILVYGDVFPKHIVKDVRLYAKKNGIQTVGVGKAPKWCDVIIKEIHPFRWIGMFKNAEFVLTNTFHGMMFCLIYNKIFYFQQEPYVKNRSDYILSLLGLDKLFLVDDFNVSKMISYNWDYKKINEILDKKREESFSFLQDALK